MTTEKRNEKDFLPAGRADFVKRMQFCVTKAGNPTALARLSGLTAPAINDYLKGKSDPSRERTIAIAKAAGVSVNWLTTGEGMPEPSISEALEYEQSQTQRKATASSEKLAFGMRENYPGEHDEILARNQRMMRGQGMNEHYGANPYAGQSAMQLPVGPRRIATILSEGQLSEKELEALISQLQLQLKVIRDFS